jgi:hypothetical protein
MESDEIADIEQMTNLCHSLDGIGARFLDLLLGIRGSDLFRGLSLAVWTQVR